MDNFHLTNKKQIFSNFSNEKLFFISYKNNGNEDYPMYGFKKKNAYFPPYK